MHHGLIAYTLEKLMQSVLRCKTKKIKYFEWKAISTRKQATVCSPWQFHTIKCPQSVSPNLSSSSCLIETAVERYFLVETQMEILQGNDFSNVGGSQSQLD